MNRIFVAALATLGVFVGISMFADASAQRRSYHGRLNMQHLVRRIEQLERRVTFLERGQPVRQEPSVMSVEDAERHLKDARHQQAFSKKLFSKGYISEAELEADGFELARALQVYHLAVATRDNGPTAEIEESIRLLEAQHELATARRQLRLAENLAANGLAGVDLPAYKRAVQDAQVRLDMAHTQQ